MAEPTVRIYDFETKTITTIPASELPPGMVRATVPGVEGEVFVDPAKAPRGAGVPLHAPFPAAVRERLARLHSVFHDVDPTTPEEWEHSFRCERDPEHEIALWLWMADVFEHFTAGRELVYQKRTDIFDVIVHFVTNGKDHVRETLGKPLTLSDRRFQEMLNYLEQQFRGACWEKYARDASGDGALAPGRPAGVVPIHALFAADGVNPNPEVDPRWRLRSAEVIMGVDVQTQRQFLVYGRDTLEEIARSGQERHVKMFFVSLDQETEELEQLLALVQTIKGRDDYAG